MNHFLMGGIAVACAAAGLFFLRYWRSSGDRFFFFLMLSFWIEAGNRIDMALNSAWNEDLPVHYMVRLLSYGLIVFAIWHKNRPKANDSLPRTPAKR